MKTKLLYSFFLLFSFSLVAQEDQNQNHEFEFDKARALLAQRNTVDALHSLRVILSEDFNNSNIHFLMGAAYAETPGEEDKAIYHLRIALKEVSEEYIVGSFKERRSPIHAYYYLGLSYVQKDQCGNANSALNKLMKYRGKIDDYFIDELSRNMEKCPFEEGAKYKLWNKPVPPPEGYEPKRVIKVDTLLDSAAFAQRGLLVQEHTYTTNAPLYGVQIGSNLNPSPVSSYGKVKNVDVFVDNRGIIRYVVGHFSIRSQAESLLKSLNEQGYLDAFIVNVNDERKYSNELISFNNINVRAGIKGKVDFYVQLGAFKESIPDSVAVLYHQIDGIEELKYENFTLMLIGPYSTYSSATLKQKELSGIVGNPFVVAFNNRKKVPLKEAIDYTKKIKEE